MAAEAAVFGTADATRIAKMIGEDQVFAITKAVTGLEFPDVEKGTWVVVKELDESGM